MIKTLVCFRTFRILLAFSKAQKKEEAYYPLPLRYSRNSDDENPLHHSHNQLAPDDKPMAACVLPGVYHIHYCLNVCCGVVVAYEIKAGQPLTTLPC